MGLGRRWVLTGHGRRGRRALFDWPQGFARDLIEDIAESPLGDLSDGLCAATLVHDIDEDGKRRCVVIKKAMVNELIVPHPFSRAHVETEDSVAKQIVTRSAAAILVTGNGSGGQIDISQLMVGGHHAPHVGSAVFPPGAFGPRVGAEFAVTRNGVERPQTFTGAYVDSPDVTRGW